MEHSAIETHNDLPSFVPERELRAALAAAQNVARQRDELATELARARRDLESSARSQRELDEAMRGGGDNLGRRIKLLRDALARKDQEILNLKTFTATHAKQLKDAQETAERLRRERGDLEARLKTRDGAFAAIERERENLSRALDGARREGERAAQVVVQADSAVHEWRAALEACTRELDEARRQLAELRGAWNNLTHERQRIVEAHAQEVGTVRTEAASTAQRLRDEMEQALSDATARYDAAREAHAIALRAAEDEHAAELAEERASRRIAEDALTDARARVSQLEAARNWADGELSALRTRLESAESIAETIAKELQESFGREIEALRKAHEAERDSLAAAYEAELKAINGALQGVVLPKGFRSLGEAYADAEGRARALAAEVESMRARVATLEAEASEATRARDDAQSDVVEVLAEKDARHAAALRELRERHDEALRDAEVRYKSSLDEARRYFNEALEAQREAHESEVASLQDNLSGDEARVHDLERDLETAREALGAYAADAAARLREAEIAADDAATARDRYAKKYAAAMQELKALKAHGGANEAARQRAVTRFVAEAMARAVEQLASAMASRHGRALPVMADVEEALSVLCEDVPEEVGEVLWSLREPLLGRCRLLNA